jgi:hypothetical protein
MPPDRCSLCDRPVLGLAGQDWCVLPWMLDAAVREDDVLPGSCHVRCLHELGVAGAWAQAVQEYHCTRWPLWRAGVESGVRWRLHCSTRARRFHLWRADGRLSSFSFGSVLAARRGRLRLTAELGEVGSAHATPLLAAMGTAANGVEVPLAAVVAALGLADRYPASTGYLARRLRDLGTTGQADLGDVLIARYPLPLGTPVLRAARGLIRDRM